MAREVYLVDAAAERTYGEAADQPKFFVNRIYEVVRPQKKPVYEFVKRAADIVFSMIFLFYCRPFLLLQQLPLNVKTAARQFTSKSG